MVTLQLKNPWSGSWYGSAPKLNGLMLMRHPNPRKISFLKIVENFLSYRKYFFLNCAYLAMVNIYKFKSPESESRCGSPPKSNQLVTHPTPPNMFKIEIRPQRFDLFCGQTDKQTKAKTWPPWRWWPVLSITRTPIDMHNLVQFIIWSLFAMQTQYQI